MTVATVVATAPLSPGQERLLETEYALADGSWPLDGSTQRLRPLDTLAVLVEGKLDLGALRQAVDALVERQAALRTTFRFRDQCPPVQIITPSRSVEVRLEHVRAEPRRVVTDGLPEIELHRRVSPTDDLFGIDVFRLERRAHVVVLRIHHLASDGWSIGVLYRELSELYAAAAERREERLPPLPLSFADYCVSMDEARRNGRFGDQLEYWRHELRDPSPPIPFTAAAPPTVARPRPMDDAEVRIAPSVVAQARAGGRRASVGGDLAGPLLAALTLVLHAETGATELDVGMMVANRMRADTEHLLGDFVNITVVRLRLDPVAPVSRLVAQANAKVAAALKNQEVPIQDVVRAVAEESAPPRYQVTLALNTMRANALAVSGAVCTELDLAATGELAGLRLVPTAIDLRWVLAERGHGLDGTLTYNTELFDGALARGYIAALEQALRALAGPDDPVGAVAARLASSGRY